MINRKQSELFFILIDDDSVSNMISKLTLEATLGSISTISFTNPEEGLTYLGNMNRNSHVDKFVLLLDLNMPIMNGWEFLDRFDNLSADTKSHVRIFILSSSIDSRDRDRSYYNKNVKDFITKPLTPEVIARLF